jgi:hypothetical protein
MNCVGYIRVLRKLLFFICSGDIVEISPFKDVTDEEREDLLPQKVPSSDAETHVCRLMRLTMEINDDDSSVMDIVLATKEKNFNSESFNMDLTYLFNAACQLATNLALYLKCYKCCFESIKNYLET